MDKLRKTNFGKSFLTRFTHPISLGFLVTLWQVIFALSAIGGPLEKRYKALSQWDGGWYRLIILEGYHAPPIEEWTWNSFGTVGFFPGFAFSAKALHSLGLHTDVAMPLAAQFYAWIMWSYWFVILKRWKLSVWVIAGATMLVVSHPAAFFLVASYSESMCLAGFLGFLIWSPVKSRWGSIIAILHGFALTTSRIVGAPIALLPIVQKVCAKGESDPSWGRSLLMVAGASLGIGSFFLFCHIRFGHWDMYQKTQEMNWQVKPNYECVIDRGLYDPRFLGRSLRDYVAQYDLGTELDATGYFQTGIGFWFFPIVALCEGIALIRGKTGWRQRLPLWFAATAFFYLAAVAHRERHFGSVTRHYFVPLIPTMLALCHVLSGYRLSQKWLWVLIPIVVLVIGVALFYQHRIQNDYLNGFWIA